MLRLFALLLLASFLTGCTTPSIQVSEVQATQDQPASASPEATLQPTEIPLPTDTPTPDPTPTEIPLPEGLPEGTTKVRGESGQELVDKFGNVIYTWENGEWVSTIPYSLEDGFIVQREDSGGTILHPDKPLDANGFTQTDRGLVITKDGNAVALLNPESNQMTITENGMLRVENQWFLYSKATNEWVLLPVEGSLNKDQVLVRQNRLTIFDKHGYIPGLFVPMRVMHLDSGEVFSVTNPSEYSTASNYLYEDKQNLYLFESRYNNWYTFPPEITREAYFQESRNNLADWLSGTTVIEDEDKFQDNGPIPLRIYQKLWVNQPTGVWSLHGVFLGMLPLRDKLVTLVGLEGPDGKRHFTALLSFQDTWGGHRYTLDIQPQNNLHPTSRGIQRIHVQPDRIMRISSPFFNTPIRIEIPKIINRVEGHDVAPYCGEAELAAAVKMGQSVYALSGPYVDMDLTELDTMTLACGGNIGISYETVGSSLIQE